MKILMINVVCGIRSTGRICTDLADALIEKGHEVKIAYGREVVPDKYKSIAVKIGTDFDVKLHGLQARIFDKAGFGSAAATRQFIDWIRKYAPDVIHLHNIHGYYINIEILFDYLKSCNKKIFWTLHDCWAFTGHSAFCDAVSCTKWKTGCKNCPNVREYPASFFDNSRKNWKKKKAIMTNVPDMTIITPSNWLAGLVKESFLSEYPVEVIHNGIDTSQFKPLENDFKEYHKISDKFMLLGAATAWNDMKGLSDFFKLADLLGEQYKIVLVGLTEKQIADLPDNILGIKRTKSIKELSSIYSAADMFLNLSYCENYPTVNLEALSCGTPVLTYDTGGSSETLGENNGIVVKRGDIEKVAEEILNYEKKISSCQETEFNNSVLNKKGNLEAQACGTPVITYNTGGSGESVPVENVIVHGKVSDLINITGSRILLNKCFDKKVMIDHCLEMYENI